MSWAGLADVELVGPRVTLRRVRASDQIAFGAIAFEPETWKYFVSRVDTAAELERFVESAVRDTLNGSRVVFAIVDNGSRRIVGSTAYGNLAEAERRIEIGWSWVRAAARRNGMNRAAKLLLLDYAFDSLDCERVEFKTDVRNTDARASLRGIGATEEGILRSFNYMPGGRRRDVVYYSILRHEWPEVRARQFTSQTGA